MGATLSIPGSPAPRAGLPPREAIERAVAGLSDLNVATTTGWFDFLRPAIDAVKVIEIDGEPVIWLFVRGHRLVRRATSAFVVEWRWRALWERDDWYEVGWLPCKNYDALDGEGRRLTWTAVNGRDIPRRR